MLGFGALGEFALGEGPPMYTIPASETPEGQERLRAYYYALGRFVDMFAEVEAGITRTLWHYAKVPPEIAKIILAGSKIDNSSKSIKQLAVATGASEELLRDLDDILQQLGIINKLRNHVVHFGATGIAEGSGSTSNALKAKGEPLVFPISPTVLEEGYSDLRKITFHLGYKHLGRPPPKSLMGQSALEIVLQSSWKYKPTNRS